MSNKARRYALVVVGLIIAAVTFSLETGSARDLLVSRVILGNSSTTSGQCPNWDPISLTDDSIAYPAGGEYTCPNGRHGYLGADPNPLSANGEVTCISGFRTCNPIFGSPTYGSDGIGPYSAVNATARGYQIPMSCVNGTTRTFKTHTTNIYDTSYECRPPDPPPPPPPCGYGGCSSWEYTNTPCGENQQVGTSYDACGCWQCLSPIVLRISGDGVPRMSNAMNGVLFDLAGKGEVIRVAWPIDDSSGWLVLDRNGNGMIDDGRELFGTATLLASGACGRSGYQALGELDSNQDGEVTNDDPSFQDLRVWVDRIRNGRTDPGELVSLGSLGVLSLHTTPKESRQKDRWGNLFRYRADVGTATKGAGKFTYDVFPGTIAATP